MSEDAQSGRRKSRPEYLAILRGAGHQGSAVSASLIVTREAKRAFGQTLGRAKSATAKKGRRGGGKPPSIATSLLREKLAGDKATGNLRDATHYLRWVVDQPGVKLGLKQARPVVYRELRVARQ